MAGQDKKNTRATKRARVVPDVQKIVIDYLAYLQKLGLSIQSAYIFGSNINGITHRWSDIDVCVVSKDFDPAVDSISYLWRKLRKQDIKAGIEPVGFHPDEFTEDVPLVVEILRHGLKMI